MATILTVEDSRVVRNVIARQVQELGFDLEQAENGEQGLAKLEAVRVDLVLLDVTMPVLDGPAMLARMRSAGNHTPVIMLTSEAKRSIVEDAIRLGISDYVLKPFGADELRSKILAVLGEAGGVVPVPAAKAAPATSAVASGAPVAAPTPVSATAAPAPMPAGGVKASAGELLIVDDVDNVAKKLRTLMPERYAIEHCLTAKMGLRLCRERKFKAVLIDSDLPPDGEADPRSPAFLSQLRAVQPRAALVALCLRTTNDSTSEMRALGYSDVLFKPFKQELVDAFVTDHLVEQEEVLTRDQDLLTLGALVGKPELREGYFARLAKDGPSALEQLAAACHEHAVLDVRKAPVDAPQFVGAIAELATRARQIGLGVKLVVNDAAKAMLGTRADTRALWGFPAVEEARAAEIDPNTGAAAEAEIPGAKESWISRLQDL